MFTLLLKNNIGVMWPSGFMKITRKKRDFGENSFTSNIIRTDFLRFKQTCIMMKYTHISLYWDGWSKIRCGLPLNPSKYSAAKLSKQIFHPTVSLMRYCTLPDRQCVLVIKVRNSTKFESWTPGRSRETFWCTSESIIFTEVVQRAYFIALIRLQLNYWS
jgi:hypothetical protein